MKKLLVSLMVAAFTYGAFAATTVPPTFAPATGNGPMQWLDSAAFANLPDSIKAKIAAHDSQVVALKAKMEAAQAQWQAKLDSIKAKFQPKIDSCIARMPDSVKAFIALRQTMMDSVIADRRAAAQAKLQAALTNLDATQKAKILAALAAVEARLQAREATATIAQQKIDAKIAEIKALIAKLQAASTK